MRVAEENRFSSGISTAAVRHSLEAHIAYLIEQIKQTEAAIQTHINNDSDRKEQSDLLDSIPGLGATTAALLLAEIVNIKEYKSARQVAAYAGLFGFNERRSYKVAVSPSRPMTSYAKSTAQTAFSSRSLRLYKRSSRYQ